MNWSDLSNVCGDLLDAAAMVVAFFIGALLETLFGRN